MSRPKKDMYVDFLQKLDLGMFRSKISAIKSASRRKISQEQKRALMNAIDTFFDVEDRKPANVAASSFEEFLRVAGATAPPMEDVAHTNLAYLAFLREAIKTNVDIAHGMKSLAELDAGIDTSEAQDVMNRLAFLSQRYNTELRRAFAIIDGTPREPS